MTQFTLDQLPNELLFQIADYVDPEHQNPKELLPLMYSCKSMFFTLRPKLYKSIYCFISFDDHTHLLEELEERKSEACYHGQVLISKMSSFTKLVELLSYRDDLLELVHHFNFQCLNFKIDNKFVSDNIIDLLHKNQHHTAPQLTLKPINFYSQSSQVNSLTLKMFKSFIHCLENHKSLDASKQILSENALVNNLDEKAKIARDEAVRRMLFCPFDFRSLGTGDDYAHIENVVKMTNIAMKLANNARNVHVSIMNLQNAMTQSSFSHTYDEDHDYFMKLNVMHYYF